MICGEVKSDFEEALELTGEPTSAAILVLAAQVREHAATFLLDSFGHQICMGIRMGLFGFGANDYSSIVDLKPDEQ